MVAALSCNTTSEGSGAISLLSLSPDKKALMNVNSRLREFYPESEELFDIVLMTNNHAQVGVRLINSINHYGTLAGARPS